MTYLVLFSIFIFGLIIGSFINALIYRMHEGVSMMGRSYCPKCKSQIAWYDNIPVLSYIFLGGKCRTCKEKISLQYPLVELIIGLLFLEVFLHIFKLQLSTFEFIILDSKLIIELIRDLFFVSIMIIIFIYDLRWYLILDRITLPSIIIIFIFNILLDYKWQNLLLAGFIGGGFFLFQFLISKGRWIGGGDIRLGVLMGVMFSWPMILLSLFLSYIIGSLISISLLVLKKKKWSSEVPLGIFLTSASIITLFWGEQILSWYLNFLL